MALRVLMVTALVALLLSMANRSREEVCTRAAISRVEEGLAASPEFHVSAAELLRKCGMVFFRPGVALPDDVVQSAYQVAADMVPGISTEIEANQGGRIDNCPPWRAPFDDRLIRSLWKGPFGKLLLHLSTHGPPGGGPLKLIL